MTVEACAPLRAVRCAMLRNAKSGDWYFAEVRAGTGMMGAGHPLLVTRGLSARTKQQKDLRAHLGAPLSCRPPKEGISSAGPNRCSRRRIDGADRRNLTA